MKKARRSRNKFWKNGRGGLLYAELLILQPHQANMKNL